MVSPGAAAEAGWPSPKRRLLGFPLPLSWLPELVFEAKPLPLLGRTD